MANAQLRYRYIENTHGNPSLIFDDYRFRVNSRREDRIYWRCIDPLCQTRIATLNNIPVKPNPLHNHQPDPIKNRVLETMNAIKKRCREDTQPVPQIYATEIAKMTTSATDATTDTTVSQLPTYQSCHDTLHRQRTKLLPRLPTILQELSLQGNKQLQLETNSYSLMMALTNAYSSSLLRTTFNTYATQKSSTQMVPSTPVQSSLLRFTRSTQKSTARCTHWYSLSYPGKVSNFTSDSINYSNLHVMPATQSFAHRPYSSSHTSRSRAAFSIIRSVYGERLRCSSLIPPTQVEDVWFNALEDIDDSDSLANTTAFKDYVTTQWIEHDRPDIWNHFNTDGPRTTNDLEGWHKMKRLVQTAHPNIYVMINHLKTVQASNKVNILRVAAGGVPRPKRRKYRHIDSRPKLLKQRLLSRSMTLMDYTDAYFILDTPPFAPWLIAQLLVLNFGLFVLIQCLFIHCK